MVNKFSSISLKTKKAKELKDKCLTKAKELEDWLNKQHIFSSNTMISTNTSEGKTQQPNVKFMLDQQDYPFNDYNNQTNIFDQMYNIYNYDSSENKHDPDSYLPHRTQTFNELNIDEYLVSPEENIDLSGKNLINNA